MRAWVAGSAAGLVLLAFAATAAEKNGDTAALRVCLAAHHDDERFCIGHVSEPCQTKPAGGTTIDIAACLDREAAAWDAILNERYATAQRVAAAVDESLKGSAIVSDPVPVAGSLRTAQRAWIAFRDAECERRFASVQEGTIRLDVASACNRDLTAERAIGLGEGGGP